MADEHLGSIRSHLRAEQTNDTRQALVSSAASLRSSGQSSGLSTPQLNAAVRLALIAGSSDAVTSRANRVALRMLGACVPRRGARLKHSAVQRIMGCLGSSPPLAEGMERKSERKHRVDVKVQEAALKLLVCCLEPPSSLAELPSSFLTPRARHTLAQSYAVLFHFLDYQTLRPHLCALLCALTRRAHVKPYRIARLLSLRTQHPLDASLAHLFATYATFIPSLLFTATLSAGSSSASRTTALLLGTTSASKHPDAAWLSSVCALHSSAPAHEEDEPPAKKARLGLGRKSTAAAAALLPAPTCHARRLAPLITEPRTPAALGGVLHGVVMPAQRAAALLHPHARLALIARSAAGGAEAARDAERIAAWVCARLGDDLASGGKGLERAEALVATAEKTWSLLGLPPLAAAWLSAHGRSAHAALLPLVHLLPPAEWDFFQENVLAPMADAARKQAETGPHAALTAMAGLLERWARLDWGRVKAKGRMMYYDATPLDPQVDYQDTIRRTAAFAADLAEELMATTTPSLATQHAFLRLYETLSLPPLVGLHTILLPAPSSLFLLLLSRAAGLGSLSRLAGLIQRVRATFNAHEAHDLPARALEELGELRYFTDENRVRLNECVVVLADATWRFGKGLQSLEQGVFSAGFPASNIKHLKARCEERGSDLAVVGSIMQGMPFLTLAEAYANELARAQGHEEPIRGPMTAGAIKEVRKLGLPNLNEFRVGLLAHMEAQGIVGLVRLLRATMSSLNSPAAVAAAAAASAAASSSQG